MSDSNSSSGGVGVAGLLGVLFVGLKLGDVIDWPWLWVLSPFWIPVAFVLVLLVLTGIVVGIGKALEANDKKKAREARLRRLR